MAARMLLGSERATRAAEVVREGDKVMLFERYDRITPCVVRSGGQTTGRYGTFQHDDLLGQPFGSRVYSMGSLGYVYVLRMTPELWTLSLPHRTQILYVADIAMVVMRLGLRPGMTVVESGTGSGSLTTALARAVQPTGKVVTFEYHQERARMARAEFEEHGLSDVVTVMFGDACGDPGLDVPAGSADAIFLDLPSPWLAIESATRALRTNGKICTFSPCIEQVLKTRERLQDCNFTVAPTVECLQRKFDVRRDHRERPAEVAELHGIPAAEGEDWQDYKRRRIAQAAGGGGGGGGGEEPVLLDRPQPGDEDLLAQPIRYRRGATGSTARPFPEMRGHTGFLTFATKNWPHQRVQGDVEDADADE